MFLSIYNYTYIHILSIDVHLHVSMCIYVFIHLLVCIYCLCVCLFTCTVDWEIFAGKIFRRLNFHVVLFRRYNHSMKISVGRNFTYVRKCNCNYA